VIAVDTNILVHAHREEMAKHRAAVRLLRGLAEGHSAWAIPIFCVGEFLRVVTHHRVFTPPSPLEGALTAIQRLMDSPSLRLLMPGERYWSLFAQTVRKSLVTGNLIYDAQIVAVCLEHGVTSLISEDRDLLRFSDLAVHPI
jgi:toxin-antitoxin system PIN domain toxin